MQSFSWMSIKTRATTVCYANVLNKNNLCIAFIFMFSLMRTTKYYNTIIVLFYAYFRFTDKSLEFNIKLYFKNKAI